MTAPLLHPIEQDPLEELKALRASKGTANDPLEQLKLLSHGKALHHQAALNDLRGQNESTGVHPTPDVPEDDYARSGIVGAVQKGAEAVISGTPFAQRAVAGYRGLIALLGGQGLQGAANEVDRSIQGGKKDVASLPAVVRLPLQLAGSVPAATIAAPLGVVGGGAAYGAAVGADQGGDTAGDVLKHAAIGAATGAIAAKGTQLIGRGVKNMADRSGVTDYLAEKTGRLIPPSIASRLGTRGQVNQALSDRQDILDALGDPGETAAKTQLDRIAARKAQASVLYGAARQDTRALQDPELQKLLSDPQVHKAYQAASELRAASGNPLPRIDAPAQVPIALQKMGVSPERYQELQALGAQRSRVPTLSGVDILPPELMGTPAKGLELPDPDVLSKVKRYLYDAAQGRQDSPLAINQDEARALLPKVDAIRQKLHELSPAWQKADSYYAGAKGEEEAFAHGFDAFRHSKNPSGGQLPTHSPEAMLASIEEPRYPGEPATALDARAKAFRAGVKAAAASQVRAAPVDAGAASALNTKALAPTEAAQQTRALMHDTPSDASALEGVLATKRGANLAADRATPGNRLTAPGFIRSLARAIASEPDLLKTPKGQAMISDRLQSPSLLLRELQQSADGKVVADALARAGLVTTGAQAAR